MAWSDRARQAAADARRIRAKYGRDPREWVRRQARVSASPFFTARGFEQWVKDQQAYNDNPSPKLKAVTAPRITGRSLMHRVARAMLKNQSRMGIAASIRSAATKHLSAARQDFVGAAKLAGMNEHTVRIQFNKARSK